jgi:hypothetical protein
VHGHTYQAHVVGCAAIVAVQRIIRERNLIANVCAMGDLLGRSLKTRLGSHRHVGDIRGRGLFWAVEFVQDRETKAPFPAKHGVSMEISELGLTEPYCMMVYPGAGTVDGVNGDHMYVQDCSPDLSPAAPPPSSQGPGFEGGLAPKTNANLPQHHISAVHGDI